MSSNIRRTYIHKTILCNHHRPGRLVRLVQSEESWLNMRKLHDKIVTKWIMKHLFKKPKIQSVACVRKKAKSNEIGFFLKRLKSSVNIIVIAAYFYLHNLPILQIDPQKCKYL